MKIKNTQFYTITLSWTELRDLSNALHDALQLRKGPAFDVFMTKQVYEYKKLSGKINEALANTRGES